MFRDYKMNSTSSVKNSPLKHNFKQFFNEFSLKLIMLLHYTGFGLHSLIISTLLMADVRNNSSNSLYGNKYV